VCAASRLRGLCGGVGFCVAVACRRWLYCRYAGCGAIYRDGRGVLQVVQMRHGQRHVRHDDAFFSEYVTNASASLLHDEDDEAHSGMTKTARDFLKKKFGTISRFYSGITDADIADVNGFSRINNLRKALAALDRGGWERSYHQRIFHVREAGGAPRAHIDIVRACVCACACLCVPMCLTPRGAAAADSLSRLDDTSRSRS